MLKSLVQLFAEKFLQSKRSWIQHAVSPTTDATAFSITADGQWHKLTSSGDGYITYSGNASSVILEVSSGGSGFVNPQSIARRHIIPVSKGQEFGYLISADTTVPHLYLVPMRGAD